MKLEFKSAAASGAAFSGFYNSPEVTVVYFQSQGVLCTSVGSEHEGFGDGGEFDL